MLPGLLRTIRRLHTSRAGTPSPLPVVLLALVVLVIAASQIQQVLDHARQLTQVTLIVVLYVALAAIIGRLTVWLYSLPPRAGRGVIFTSRP